MPDSKSRVTMVLAAVALSSLARLAMFRNTFSRDASPSCKSEFLNSGSPFFSSSKNIAEMSRDNIQYISYRKKCLFVVGDNKNQESLVLDLQAQLSSASNSILVIKVSWPVKTYLGLYNTSLKKITSVARAKLQHRCYSSFLLSMKLMVAKKKTVPQWECN